jgi:hypothetical protein
MSTPTVDRDLQPLTRRRQRWLVPIAAAAAVSALASGPLWWPGGDGSSGGPAQGASTDAASAPAAPAGATGHYGLLPAPGWTLDRTSDDVHGGEADFVRGEQELTVSWYPAASYEDYVEDRRHITEPPRDGAPIEVLGLAGQLWSYNPTDHTVIREVQGGFWTELRGSGMSASAFRTLVDQVRLVDLDEFEANLPDHYVRGAGRDAAVTAILDDIEAVSGKGLPAGKPGPTSTEPDPYDLGADVAGAYTCAWVEEFATGDRAEAKRVLRTARQWPVLRKMKAEGDYPDVVWEIADAVVAGHVPPEYREGLDCP